MKKSVLQVFVTVLFLSAACERSLYFNDFEKSLLEIYSEGDTLIFESDKGVRDTSYIVFKDIGSARSDPVAHLGKYKQLRGFVYSSSRRIKEDNKPISNVLSLYKNHPRNTYFYLFSKGAIVGIKFEDFSVESLEEYKVEDGLYRFRQIRTYKGVAEETQLFFDLKYGIVKYITSEGEVWKRINIQ